MMPGARRLAVALTLLGTAQQAAAQARTPRIGVVSSDLGSFAATILKSMQVPFEQITPKVAADSLKAFGVIVVDNLYRLKDLNGPAFKDYVAQGGVLAILNPKVDGFSKTWSAYDLFIGEYAIEGRIVDKKHPIFQGFPNDKLQDFADSNGPFVGNCSLTEPAKQWKVLARHAKKGKNALIVEAAWGSGHAIVACTRFDHHNAKPGPTRLGDNLFKYLMDLARR